MLIPFILLCLVYSTYSCPPDEYISPLCSCRIVGSYSMMTCSEVTTPEDLIHPLRVAADYDMFSLIIADSTIQYIPDGIFKGSKFKKVMFANSQIMSLSSSDLAFEGLEDHLEEIRATDAHYITSWDWSQLRDLRRIDLIDVHLISMYALDQELPRLESLTSLGISRAEISFLHPEAFRQLTGLRMLILKDNDIEEMERGMLPSPALQLMMIDISGNKLSSLPSDFFSNLPSLEEVNLSNNKFVTLDEDTFSPLMESVSSLNMIGNEFSCDCRMRWLASTRKPSQLRGQCSQPNSLKGYDLKYLTASGLWC